MDISYYLNLLGHRVSQKEFGDRLRRALDGFAHVPRRPEQTILDCSPKITPGIGPARKARVIKKK